MPRSKDAKQALSTDQEGPSDAARADADAELGREPPRDEKLGPQLPGLPLIPGESESEYQELVAGLETTLRPRDFIEAVHCRNIADVIWEEHRLRRSKHSLLIDDRRRAMRDYLTGLLTSRPGLIGSEEPDLLARGWIIGDPSHAREEDHKSYQPGTCLVSEAQGKMANETRRSADCCATGAMGSHMTDADRVSLAKLMLNSAKRLDRRCGATIQ